MLGAALTLCGIIHSVVPHGTIYLPWQLAAGAQQLVYPFVGAYIALAVVFGLLSSTMERDLANETIETFGKHVLPAFDPDPVHRTTRQREAAASAR